MNDQEFTLAELQHPTTPLARLYAKKLLKRGWAGRYSLIEKEYVRWFRERHENDHQTTRPLVNKGL